ncbi:hypothetical protein [Limnobaculum parvum]|uniref:Pilus assembly protein PilO n=1 Tax=Limnobaculum parvum TaxID=2172103 RepID=A0A2Y9TYN3_9GAMM|nr:hypothetical protein [Limnobaculum parvum]AWH88569.1 hypothetical protein HYN51_08370 [Limnobaculum parvum]
MIGGAQIDWQYVIFAPLWLRHSIIAFASILMGMLGWYFTVVPLTEVNQQVQIQLDKAKQQALVYQQQWAALPEINLLKAQIQQIESELQPYHYQPDNGAEFIRLITGYISASGCHLIDIGAPFVSQRGTLTLYDWQLKVSANYFQFVELIKLISDGVRLTTISHLTLDGGPRLTINMTVRLYQLNQGPV